MTLIFKESERFPKVNGKIDKVILLTLSGVGKRVGYLKLKREPFTHISACFQRKKNASTVNCC